MDTLPERTGGHGSVRKPRRLSPSCAAPLLCAHRQLSLPWFIPGSREATRSGVWRRDREPGVLLNFNPGSTLCGSGRDFSFLT